MTHSAIFLTVVISVIIASTSGFKIENPQAAGGIRTLAGSNGFFASTQKPKISSSSTSFLNQPIAGYPKVPPPNAYEAGGHEDDLLPPFEDGALGFTHLKGQRAFRRSIDEAKVDPKTGYPLMADPKWNDAGGNEEILELPLEDFEITGGQEQEAVDPKTGYPLVARAGWKDAGGDEAILELPLEDSEFPDQGQEAVDPKTGYPLVAQPGWKFAGGDGAILQAPTEEDEPREKVDPKTGYPLVAQPAWKDAGGNEEILELPFEDSLDEGRVAVDPKTGYPLVAQPGWKGAGGDGDILDLPLQDSDDPKEKVDPKTGYPLVAQPTWKDAGGNGDILELPLQDSHDNFLQEKLGVVVEEQLLTELRPPPLHSNYPAWSTYFFFPPTSFQERSSQQNSVAPFEYSQNQRRSTVQNQQQFGSQNKPVESSYTYTGPENVIVTVTRFLNTNKQGRQQPQTEFDKNRFAGFQSNGPQPSSTPSFQNNGRDRFRQ